MAFILRKCEKARWRKDPNKIPLLNPSDIRGDALKDFNTTQDKLSVYVVTDLNSIKRVAAALSARRNVLDNFDYFIVEEEKLLNAGFIIEEVDGETADESVDKWHRDLTRLGVGNLVQLAYLFSDAYMPERVPERILVSEVKTLIADGVRSGNIQLNKVTPELQVKLGLS